MIDRYMRRTLLATFLLSGLLTNKFASAQEMLTPDGLDQLGVQRYWHARFPVPALDSIERAVLIDDAVYLITGSNVTLAVHSKTGVIRWTNLAAETGQTIRGPTHSEDFAIFTGAASVRAFNRRTGELQGVPRRLSGFIIDVSHDIVRVTIGEDHGIRLDDTLDVMDFDENGDPIGEPLAQVKITSVERLQSKGRLLRESRTTQITTGRRVFGQKTLPVQSTRLPTAASSPAVADSKYLYIGAANQRLYSIETITGFINWQVTTPRTVTTTPVLYGDDLYFADQQGLVISCTKLEKIKNWSYQTEGPIFVDMAVSENYVYVVSDDRSIYCLDRQTGHRVWRKQFDNPPAQRPYLAFDRVYQHIPGEGLFVLDAKTGRQIWEQRDGGRFLSQFGKDLYLVQEDGEHTLQRVDAQTGEIKVRATIPMADYVVASQTDQLILLVSKFGASVCLRPKYAPTLRPDELAQVLRDDRKIELAAAQKAEAAAGKKVVGPVAIEDTPLPPVSIFGEDDWLTDHSGTAPVGGSGLVNVGQPKPAAEKGKKPAAKEADKKAKKEDTADKDEDESEDEESADEDSEDEEGKDADSDEDSKDEEGKDADSDEDSEDEDADSDDDSEEEDGDSDEDESGDEEEDEDSSDDE